MYLFIVTDGSGLHTTCFATFRFDALLLHQLVQLAFSVLMAECEES